MAPRSICRHLKLFMRLCPAAAHHDGADIVTRDEHSRNQIYHAKSTDQTGQIPRGGRVASSQEGEDVVVAGVPVPAAGVGVRGGDVGGAVGGDGEGRARGAPWRAHGVLQVLAGRRREAGEEERWRRRRRRRAAAQPPGDAGGIRAGARRRGGVVRRARRRGRGARPGPQRRAHRPLPQTSSRGTVHPSVQWKHATQHGDHHLLQLRPHHHHHDLHAAPRRRPPGPAGRSPLPRRGRLRRRHRRQLLPPLPPLTAEERRRRRREGVQDPHRRPLRARRLPALPVRDRRLLRLRHDRADGARARRGLRLGGVPRREELRHQEVVRVQVRGFP